MRSTRSPILLRIGCGLWLLTVLAGATALWAYEKRPARPAPAPLTWPQNAWTQPAPHQAAVVLFLHPFCPCSRASLSEFQRLDLPQEVERHIVFFFPQRDLQEPRAWQSSPLVHAVQQSPEVSMHIDEGGTTIDMFHAQTSGECFAYSPQGELVFAGGLTVSRGHEGINEGTAGLERSLRSPCAEVVRYPAYGCPLKGN